MNDASIDGPPLAHARGSVTKHSLLSRDLARNVPGFLSLRQCAGFAGQDFRVVALVDDQINRPGWQYLKRFQKLNQRVLLVGRSFLKSAPRILQDMTLSVYGRPSSAAFAKT